MRKLRASARGQQEPQPVDYGRKTVEPVLLSIAANRAELARRDGHPIRQLTNSDTGVQLK